jgi:choline dehydrogenase-like flavoprotein
VDAAGDLPSAKYACNVGGMAAHWTCVIPRPAGCERTTLVAPALLDAALTQAESFLAVSVNPFPPTPVVTEVRSVLIRAFPGLRRQVQPLPMAVNPAASGSAWPVWSGVDTILAPVTTPGLEILAKTVATRLHVHRDEVSAVEVFDLEQRQSGTVRADAVMVAPDAFHTPQLLWASGIMPRALGRYLNVHHQATATVGLGSSQGGRFSPDDRDDIVGALWVPFDDVRHPFHGQTLVIQSRGQQRAVHLAWYAPQEPNCDNRVRFDGNGLDGFGLPRPRIDFRYNDTGRRLRKEVRARVEHAASALGDYMEGGSPRLLPPGSAIHYQGTVRMGASDDGTSVCDRTGRVWGLGNLYLAGNGVIDRATAVNPTLTSVALAILSGQAVAKRFQSRPRTPVA